jgi:hypothetical protein
VLLQLGSGIFFVRCGLKFDRKPRRTIPGIDGFQLIFLCFNDPTLAKNDGKQPHCLICNNLPWEKRMPEEQFSRRDPLCSLLHFILCGWIACPDQSVNSHPST